MSSMRETSVYERSSQEEIMILKRSQVWSDQNRDIPGYPGLVDFFEEVPEYDSAMYCHKKMKTNERLPCSIERSTSGSGSTGRLYQ